MTQQQPLPKREIRRFDIFAEWKRLKGLTKAKLREADAQAYGLAVAKIVAARKFSGHDPAQAKELKRKAKDEEGGEPWWEHRGSAEEFARKVVGRMGEAFYREMFQPAVREAWDEDQRYEAIRDALREPWNRQLRAWQAQSEAEIDPATAAVVRLATHALWTNDLLLTNDLSPELLRQIVARLEALTSPSQGSFRSG